MNTSIFVIPKDSGELDKDIKSRKPKYMNHVLDIFVESFSGDVIPSKISLFKFKNTNLEVVIKDKTYIKNLKNLLDYYSIEEEYEKCSIIKGIINKIDNMNNIDDEAKQD